MPAGTTGSGGFFPLIRFAALSTFPPKGWKAFWLVRIRRGLSVSASGCARHTRSKSPIGPGNFHQPPQQYEVRILSATAVRRAYPPKCKTSPGIPTESRAIKSFTQFFQGRRGGRWQERSARDFPSGQDAASQAYSMYGKKPHRRPGAKDPASAAVTRPPRRPISRGPGQSPTRISL